MAEAKIDVRINASDLEALRALAERMERAAQQTEVLTSLRLPLPPGACRACEAKDRGLHLEQLARIHYAKLLDEKHFSLIEVKKEREALAAALEDERTHLSLLRILLERESGEHFATRIRLRDALRDGAAYAKEAADYATTRGEHTYASTAREDAARFDAARAALGLDEITMPAAPAADETTSPLAEAIDRQIMAKTEPAAPEPEPAKPERMPFRAGDIVKHGPSVEDWVLACDEFEGCVIPAGWPESVANASDCELVKAGSDSDRISMLKRVAGSGGMRGARAADQLKAAAPEPAPAQRRRRFLAGDRVRPAAQEIVYSAVLDEDDSGSVAIQIGSRKYLNVGASALELVKSTTQAKRNSELAFHFHLWNTSMDANVMDSVPEFVRVAAEQLLRDPFGTEYGSVLAGPETGGAK